MKTRESLLPPVNNKPLEFDRSSIYNLADLISPNEIEVYYIPEKGNFFGSRKGVGIKYKPTGKVFESVSERSEFTNRAKCFDELLDYIKNHRG